MGSKNISDIMYSILVGIVGVWLILKFIEILFF